VGQRVEIPFEGINQWEVGLGNLSFPIIEAPIMNSIHKPTMEIQNGSIFFIPGIQGPLQMLPLTTPATLEKGRLGDWFQPPLSQFPLTRTRTTHMGGKLCNFNYIAGYQIKMKVKRICKNILIYRKCSSTE